MKSQIQKACFEVLQLISKKYLGLLSSDSFEQVQKLASESLKKYQEFNSQIYLRYFLQAYCGYYKSEPHLSGFLEVEKILLEVNLQVLHHGKQEQEFMR